MNAAKEIIAVDVSVAHQRPAVKTTAEQNRYLVVVSNDYQVDLTGQRVSGLAILKLTPIRYLFKFTHFSCCRELILFPPEFEPTPVSESIVVLAALRAAVRGFFPLADSEVTISKSPCNFLWPIIDWGCPRH